MALFTVAAVTELHTKPSKDMRKTDIHTQGRDEHVQFQSLPEDLSVLA